MLIPPRSAAVCLLLALPGPGAAETASVPADAVAPIVLLERGQIAACGISVEAMSEGAPLRLEVKVVRDGEASVFEIAASAAPPRALRALRIVTAEFDTAEHFPEPTLDERGSASARTRLGATDGARFMQSLMVLGGTAEVRFAEGAALRIDLPRPMPQSVRQPYLNCAGDLFRP